MAVERLILAGRKSVLREAWAAHPERFVRGVPKPKLSSSRTALGRGARSATPRRRSFFAFGSGAQLLGGATTP